MTPMSCGPSTRRSGAAHLRDRRSRRAVLVGQHVVASTTMRWSASSGLPEGDRVVYAVSTVAPGGNARPPGALGQRDPDDDVADRPAGAGRRAGGTWSAATGVEPHLPPVLLGDRDGDRRGRHERRRRRWVRTTWPSCEVFYDSDPGAAFFLPSMLDDGTFAGVRDGGRLVAVAGTHVLAPQVQAAAIGAVLTVPDPRGQGLAATVTAGVWRRLAGRAALVGLNCADRNVAATAGSTPASDSSPSCSTKKPRSPPDRPRAGGHRRRTGRAR